jgi:phosphonopyruvate decarboxylase
MIHAKAFFDAAGACGIRLYSGVPCSYLKPFINYAINSPDWRYVGAANEGDAVAIASGAELAGVGAAVMFQNSGLGNAVSPLTSLNAIFRIPVLLIITLRGERNGSPDEPQHEVMGEITTGLLELMGIRWEFFPTNEDEVAPCINRARSHSKATGLPFALVMRKDSVSETPLGRQEARHEVPAPLPHWSSWQGARLPRADVLRTVQSHARRGDVIVATTGHTGRELYACGDLPNQFYMVGSMGCASSFGLGLALAQPERRVIVLDGDGAALMRLGALPVLGLERPRNLLHIVLDNEAHESTGAQATVSASADFAQIAAASGYPVAIRARGLDDIAATLDAPSGDLSLIHVKTQISNGKGLPRPSITPRAVAARLREHLNGAI